MTTEEPEGLQPLTDSQLEALETAVASYQSSITAGAAGYLLDRGIGPEEAATYRLGVVADPEPGHGHVQGFLAIPYLDHEGRPVSLRFRCMESHDHREARRPHGKYMSLVEEPSRLYNVGAIHVARNEIHIAEGELDALILSKIGLSAVGVAGIDAWMPHHRRMVAGFSRIYLWGDPDDAGAKFVGALGRQLRSARGVKLGVGDVTETYKQLGADGLLELIGR